jgi:Fic family protein
MKHPARPPDWSKVLSQLTKDPKRLRIVLNIAAGGVGSGPYEHWEKVRFQPVVEPLTAEEMWAGIKFKRMSARNLLPFWDKNHRQFYFSQIGDSLRALHEIDSNARGTIGVPGAGATAENRDIYLQKSLVEEPFSSSVLEGAATTREVAQKLIEEGREPKTIGDRMVLNNYKAMAFIREHSHEPLTPARVLELHRILTVDTLARPEKVGVLRAPEDDVRVVDAVTDETLHNPPAAAELRKRLQSLCDFANAPTTAKDVFLHPVIRAIVMHFMLAYDHPFWDGNGRCARALFYWCVLKHGYWMLEYVSISAVIMRAPVQYGMAFLYTESDEGDVTYFIQHQLKVIETSLADLQRYLLAKTKELSALGDALGALEGVLNRRQLSVIQHLLKRPSARITIAQHEERHSVSYLTARSDLESLADRKLLKKSKDGTRSVFTAFPNFKERLGVSGMPKLKYR